MSEEQTRRVTMATMIGLGSSIDNFTLGINTLSTALFHQSQYIAKSMGNVADQFTAFARKFSEVIEAITPASSNLNKLGQAIGDAAYSIGYFNKYAMDLSGKALGTISTNRPQGLLDQLYTDIRENAKSTFEKKATADKNDKGGGGIAGAIKGIAGMLKGLLKATLIIEPLASMLDAFLAPLEFITPFFELWGAMLSQILMPMMPELMEIMTELTPLIAQIVLTASPIAELSASMLSAMIPLLTVLISILNFILSIIAVLTNLVSVLKVAMGYLEVISTFVLGFITNMIDKATSSINGIGTFLGRMWDQAYNWLQGIIDSIKELFTSWFGSILETGRNFIEGGFDGDPKTWW